MSQFPKMLENLLGSQSKVAVLRILLGSRIGYSGSEIARRAGIGLLAIQNALADLEACGLVEVERGKVEHRYRLNTDHYFVAHGLRKIYAGEREMLRSLAEDLRPLLEGKVIGAGLFGSAARGEAKVGSDIDLMVVVGTLKEYNHVSALLHDSLPALTKRYGWPIQPVIYQQKILFKNNHTAADFILNAERDWVHVTGANLHELRSRYAHTHTKGSKG
jgi:predicted nucleotidyltransferase